MKMEANDVFVGWNFLHMRVHFYKNWSTFTITSEVYLRSAEKMRVSGIQLIEGKKKSFLNGESFNFIVMYDSFVL